MHPQAAFFDLAVAAYSVGVPLRIVRLRDPVFIYAPLYLGSAAA